MATVFSEFPTDLAELTPAGFAWSALSSNTLDDEIAAKAFRNVVQEARENLFARFEAGADVVSLVGAYTQFVDKLVGCAWSRFLGDTEQAALVAVGGYGRGELHPNSDVDLLVLIADGAVSVEEGLQAFIRFLWDIGLEPGSSVRSPRECEELARADVTVVTTLIEARRLTGNDDLLAEMRACIGPQALWSGRDFLSAKTEEQAARHHRFDDTAYKLEPNVKEGPGGLRDIHTVAWVAKRHFGAESLHELVEHDYLTAAEHDTLVEGQNFLWRVRFALHFVAGRREDRLLFSHQRRLAELFGFHDDDANLAVEKFMKSYYRQVKELSRINEMLLELLREVIVQTSEPARIDNINRRFRAVDGYLDVVNENVFKRYPFALLELFLVLQQHPELKGLRASMIRLILDHRYLIDEKFRGDIRNRSLFLEMLRQPRYITREFRRMHRYGILENYLPEFGAVVGQMQYDLFHAYTVDDHSLFVLSRIRAFAVPEKRHLDPRLAEIFDRLPKPEILYLAGIFHDIAKGQGGDHSELGATAAEEFCVRHGLSRYDSRLVSWLVRHHLTMSTTAQRRDLSDPQVIEQFAAEVGDQEHLEYLYLLTVADIRGTNPTLWNDWKASLLRDLYLLTMQVLRRDESNAIDREEIIRERQAEAARQLAGDAQATSLATRLWSSLGVDYFIRHSADEVAWHTSSILGASLVDLPLVLVREDRGSINIFVYAADQKFLFAGTTTVLGRLGLSIVDSRIITTDNGMTLDSYVVLDRQSEAASKAQRRRAIRDTLSHELRTPAQTRDRVDDRRPRRHLAEFQTETVVNFLDDERRDRTVMELVAADQPGLLAKVGWALADSEVRLQSAKIATFGERAEDVFFLTNGYSRALDREHRDAVRQRVEDAIADNNYV